MENFIVRIYRRDNDNPQKIAGLVENVIRGENSVFKNIEELMAILSTLPKGADFKFRVE